MKHWCICSLFDIYIVGDDNVFTADLNWVWFMFFSTRAAGELDGHEGDAAGGHGVQCEVPGYDPGGSAQRRGHGLRCHPQDCCHGERLHLLPSTNFCAAVDAEAHRIIRLVEIKNDYRIDFRRISLMDHCVSYETGWTWGTEIQQAAVQGKFSIDKKMHCAIATIWKWNYI